MTITLFRTPSHTPAEEIVRRQVHNRIVEQVSAMRLNLAMARAERLVWAGAQMQTAIDRAVCWALAAD